MPFVSIVIPSYNHGHFLCRTINSVLGQTYKNWELIVVDNNSTDTTNEVLSGFRNDTRIRVISVSNKGIVALSRNRGIAESTGEWIAFLDSDDWWEPHKLELCLQQSEQADVIYHDMAVNYESGKQDGPAVMRSRQLPSPVFRNLLIGGNTLINSSVMVRRKLLAQVNGLDERKEFVTAEDYHGWLKLSLTTDRFLHIAQKLGFYTVHTGGLSQRDVSPQLRAVVKEFHSHLSMKDQKTAEALIRYSRIKTMLNTRFSYDYTSDLKYCLCYGTFSIQLKSLVTWMQLVFTKRIR